MLLAMLVGVYYVFYISNFYCKVATSVCSCRTLFTIFVVFVVYGDSSNYSTQRSLLRMFSILYPYFYSIDSVSMLLLPVFD